MDENNKTIQSLWIGESLEAMELLTIASFLDHGHDFVLWTYTDIKNVPDGIDVRPAAEILPSKFIFTLKSSAHHGSVAHFADKFRFKLLEKHGGWWVDMDVTCLKPFDIDEPYVFKKNEIASAPDIIASINIIKCPAKSEVMRYTFEKANRYLKPDNVDWHLPTKIFSNALKREELEKYIRVIKELGSDSKAIDYFEGNDTIFESQYAVHWNKSLLIKKGIDIVRPVEGTLYQKLLTKYGISHENRNRTQTKD